jgi:hypothetical protein
MSKIIIGIAFLLSALFGYSVADTTQDTLFGGTILFPYQGGTGTSTLPALDELLVGDGTGKYTFINTDDIQGVNYWSDDGTTLSPVTSSRNIQVGTSETSSNLTVYGNILSSIDGGDYWFQWDNSGLEMYTPVSYFELSDPLILFNTPAFEVYADYVYLDTEITDITGDLTVGGNSTTTGSLEVGGNFILNSVTTSCGTLGTDGSGVVVCNDLGGMFGNSEAKINELEARIAELENMIKKQESFIDKIINFIWALSLG